MCFCDEGHPSIVFEMAALTPPCRRNFDQVRRDQVRRAAVGSAEMHPFGASG